MAQQTTTADDAAAPTPEADADAPHKTTSARAAQASSEERVTDRVAPRPVRVALLIYLVCAVVYSVFAAERLRVHSPDNHFSYLADAYLHGTLAVRCDARDVPRTPCPPGGGGNDWARYEGRWYVAFPSFPAVVYMPGVALLGRDFPNVWVDVLLAGLAPALLYLLLERLARRGDSRRSWRENLAFAFLFAFGTVYFFSSVQGSVWFTAHVVGCSLAVGFVWCALDARRPLLAGLCLGLAFHTRTSMLFAAPLFAWEALRFYQRAPAGDPLDTDAPEGVSATVVRVLRNADWLRAVRAMALFALPVAAAIGVYMLLNKLRFGDAGEVGYRYLQIRWRDRIEHWGLFNYHYLGRNLGIALASLPWLTRQYPHIMVSLHGLALWVTTPHYLELMRLRRRVGDRHTVGLALAVALVASTVLLYQNSGWVQFGFRFSNDFAIFLFVLLAINGRKVGRLWLAAMVVAIVVNGFGAATFGRQVHLGGRQVDFYDNDYSQQRYFQPD
jgi:chromate transport protein ChrA